MKKSEPQTGPLTAAALIASRVVSTSPELPAAALKELRELCSYNDGVSRARRLGAADAIRMLDSYGVHIGRTGLNRICHEQLRRTSYAQA